MVYLPKSAKSPASEFDHEFADQIFATGKIEEGRIIRNFFKRTGQPLRQDWLIEMARRLLEKLPLLLMIKMGLATVFRPRARRWAKARPGPVVVLEQGLHAGPVSGVEIGVDLPSGPE